MTIKDPSNFVYVKWELMQQCTFLKLWKKKCRLFEELTLAYRLCGSVAEPLLALALRFRLRAVDPFEVELDPPPWSSSDAFESSSDE